MLPLRPHRLAPLVLLVALYGCTSGGGRLAQVEGSIDAVRAAYAPDARTARFEVTPERRGGELVLAGETTLPEAKRLLLDTLARQGVRVRDEIALLPDARLEGGTRALVNVSVANLRAEPRHSAELSTQALLGTPLRVYKQQGGFYLVQTPDRYLGWVDGGGITRLGDEEFRLAEEAPKLIYLETYGFALEAPDQFSARVSDLVGGSVLALHGKEGGFYRVGFPDGRTAYVARIEASPYDDWLAGIERSEASLVETAKTLMGVPYLWGGTSAKGMDCSGFTKTVYLLHGMVLPRDASQQAATGEVVDDRGDFSRLRPGDLLFFGSPAAGGKPERVVHVGMWIGGGEFIHAAGRVQINSLDPAAPHYDEFNHRRYLRTKRLLGHPDGIVVLQPEAGAAEPVSN